MPFEAEAVEQRVLHHRPFAHHRPNLLSPGEVNQDAATASSAFFNSIDPLRSLAESFRGVRLSIRRHVARGGLQRLAAALAHVTQPLTIQNSLQTIDAVLPTCKGRISFSIPDGHCGPGRTGDPNEENVGSFNGRHGFV